MAKYANYLGKIGNKNALKARKEHTIAYSVTSERRPKLFGIEPFR